MIKKYEVSYKLDEFEFLSKENLDSHYNKLYDGYVKQYNQIYLDLNIAIKNGDVSKVKYLNDQLSYMGDGYYLHTLFFENLTPHNQGLFSDNLQLQLKKDFNIDIEQMIVEYGLKIRGNGWVILGWDEVAKRLVITSHESHQHGILWTIEPLIVLDMWEHSYYLDYQTNKEQYLRDLCKLIDVNVVNKRFEKLMKQ